MSDKKFAGLNGSVDTPAVNADYESARLFDKVRVGKLGLYFRDGFKIRYLDYPSLERVFIRVGQEIADVMSEKEKEMDAALACIHEMAPALAIGFVAKD